MVEQSRGLLVALLAMALSGCATWMCPIITDDDRALADAEDPAGRAELEAEIEAVLDELREAGKLEASAEVRCDYELMRRPECVQPGWHCELELFAVGDVDRAGPSFVEHLETKGDRHRFRSPPLEGCASGPGCAIRVDAAEAEAIARSACVHVREGAVELRGVTHLYDERSPMRWRVAVDDDDASEPGVAEVDAATGELLRCEVLREL